jgi:hypothetical protein
MSWKALGIQVRKSTLTTISIWFDANGAGSVSGGQKARKNGDRARIGVDQQGNWMSAIEKYVDPQCSGSRHSFSQVRHFGDSPIH